MLYLHKQNGCIIYVGWRNDRMDQKEINRAEWENPENWSGPKWLSVYFCKADTRTWVPKQIPGMGATLNLGKRAGVFWLVGFLVGFPLLVILLMALSVGGV
jgi:uncharacterized membrane protein